MASGKNIKNSMTGRVQKRSARRSNRGGIRNVGGGTNPSPEAARPCPEPNSQNGGCGPYHFAAWGRFGGCICVSNRRPPPSARQRGGSMGRQGYQAGGHAHNLEYHTHDGNSMHHYYTEPHETGAHTHPSSLPRPQSGTTGGGPVMDPGPCGSVPPEPGWSLCPDGSCIQGGMWECPGSNRRPAPDNSQGNVYQRGGRSRGRYRGRRKRR